MWSRLPFSRSAYIHKQHPPQKKIIKNKQKIKTLKKKTATNKHRNVTMYNFRLTWMIGFLLFNVPLENISLIWSRPYLQNCSSPEFFYWQTGLSTKNFPESYSSATRVVPYWGWKAAKCIHMFGIYVRSTAFEEGDGDVFLSCHACCNTGPRFFFDHPIKDRLKISIFDIY